MPQLDLDGHVVGRQTELARLQGALESAGRALSEHAQRGVQLRIGRHLMEQGGDRLSRRPATSASVGSRCRGSERTGFAELVYRAARKRPGLLTLAG
ncbi:MAG: hypothetical protein ACR2G2_08310 [Pseudonocardia sp.]